MIAYSRVLIIDDNHMMRRILTSILKRMGVTTVVECESGEAAVYKMNGRKFDLVICDRFMPGLSGIGVVRTMRRNRNETPFILMSGKSADDAQEELVSMGSAFVLKPFGVDALRRAIAEVLDKPAKQFRIERDLAA